MPVPEKRHGAYAPPVDSLAKIQAQICDCRQCPRLVRWREQVAREKRAAFRDWDYWGRPLSGFGDPKARLLIVGLAPAAHGANRTGRLFTGDRSGDWLFAALFRAGYANQPTSTHGGDGLRLRDAYVTAVVRCPPPQNRPTPRERDNCLPYLVRELEQLRRGRIVVALGAFAHQAVTTLYHLHPRPPFRHGVEVALPDGRTLLASFHPSQQNTFTGKLTQPMFDSIFRRARELTTG